MLDLTNGALFDLVLLPPAIALAIAGAIAWVHFRGPR